MKGHPTFRMRERSPWAMRILLLAGVAALSVLYVSTADAVSPWTEADGKDVVFIALKKVACGTGENVQRFAVWLPYNTAAKRQLDFYRHNSTLRRTRYRQSHYGQRGSLPRRQEVCGLAGARELTMKNLLLAGVAALSVLTGPAAARPWADTFAGCAQQPAGSRSDCGTREAICST
jgi:hypothetical protein